MAVAAHRQATAALGRSLARGGMVVISGIGGTDRRELIADLMNSLDRRRLTIGLLNAGEARCAPRNAAARVFGLGDSGVAAEGEAAAGAALAALVRREARQGRRCLLLVDTAETLEAEAVASLATLAERTPGQPALPVVLFGCPNQMGSQAWT